MAESAAIDRLRAELSGGVAVSDGVHRTLREAIIRGYLAPGTRLAEEDLARRFEVSRTPVREALLRLETEQLAERVSRRGLVVATITLDEILDLYVARQAIDTQAARLAATHASPPGVAELRWQNDRIRTAAMAGDFGRMADLNIEFHESLCRVGRSPLLLSFMRQVHDGVRRYPGTTFSWPGRALEAVAEHDALVDSIERHEADTAGRIALDHMERARAIRLRMIASAPAAEGTGSS